jgi:hypothetical protein
MRDHGGLAAQRCRRPQNRPKPSDSLSPMHFYGMPVLPPSGGRANIQACLPRSTMGGHNCTVRLGWKGNP